MTEIKRGTRNVHADLKLSAADELLVKARLAHKIAESVRRRGWTQAQAAKTLGLTQPKLSNLLRGNFRGFSQAKLMTCLAQLGYHVDIVVKEPGRSAKPGYVAVVL